LSRLGTDQQVAVAAFPFRGVSNQSHRTVQHLHGRLTGILVFRHRRSGGQRHQGLAQDVLVAAVTVRALRPAGAAVADFISSRASASSDRFSMRPM
jgi:hypothetical protein